MSLGINMRPNVPFAKKHKHLNKLDWNEFGFSAHTNQAVRF